MPVAVAGEGPGGDGTTRSVPVRPCLPLPWPWVPEVALRYGWSLKESSEATLWSANSQTSPPCRRLRRRGRPGNVGFAPERHRSGAAIAGFHMDLALVNEHTRLLAVSCARPSANWVEVQHDLETGLVAGRSDRLDVHKPSPVALSETDMAFDQGEQCIVAPPSHAAARVEPGAALADDDRPRRLTAPPSNTFTPSRWPALSRPLRVLPPPLVLDTSQASLVIAVTSMTCTAGDDPRTVAGASCSCKQSRVPSAPSPRRRPGRRHFRPGKLCRSGQHGPSVDQQYGREGNLVAFGRAQPFNDQPLAFFDALLFAARFDHRIHRWASITAMNGRLRASHPRRAAAGRSAASSKVAQIGCQSAAAAHLGPDIYGAVARRNLGAM